jgi:hypothetical protein
LPANAVDDATGAQLAFTVILAAFMLAAIYTYEPMIGGPLLLLVASVLFFKVIATVKGG